MAARKRKPKKSARKRPKKRAKRGAKRGARRRSGTAKRGAARTNLRAGLVVAGKPNKKSLKAKCLKAKAVGKGPTGKKMYKITSNKVCKTAKMTVTQARSLLKREGVKKPTKKQIAEKVRIAKSFTKLSIRDTTSQRGPKRPAYHGVDEAKAYEHW